MKTKRDKRASSSARNETEQPMESLRTLESAACQDLDIARLVIGFYDAILGADDARLFPGYRWSVGDLARLPASLRAPARVLLTWAQNPAAEVACVSQSRAAVIRSVMVARKRSPYGQRTRRIASELRQKYAPVEPPRNMGAASLASGHAIGVLADQIGLPLTPRTLRLVQSLKPTAIQIAAHDSLLPWGFVPGTAYVRLRADGYTIESILLGVELPAVSVTGPRFEGLLIDYFETGTEGLVWAIEDDQSFEPDALHIIEEGDRLTVRDQLGKRLWTGVVRCDRKAGWRPHPANPAYGQPSALGYWIHWTQQGFEPDAWARFFVRPPYDRFRGVLVKSQRRMID